MYTHSQNEGMGNGLSYQPTLFPNSTNFITATSVYTTSITATPVHTLQFICVYTCIHVCIYIYLSSEAAVLIEAGLFWKENHKRKSTLYIFPVNKNIFTYSTLYGFHISQVYIFANKQIIVHENNWLYGMLVHILLGWVWASPYVNSSHVCPSVCTCVHTSSYNYQTECVRESQEYDGHVQYIRQVDQTESTSGYLAMVLAWVLATVRLVLWRCSPAE